MFVCFIEANTSSKRSWARFIYESGGEGPSTKDQDSAEVPLDQPSVDGGELSWDSFPPHCFFTEGLCHTLSQPSLQEFPHQNPCCGNQGPPGWDEDFMLCSYRGPRNTRTTGSKLTTMYEEPARSCTKFILACP